MNSLSDLLIFSADISVAEKVKIILVIIRMMKVRNPMAGQSNRKVVKYRRKPKAAGLIFAIVIIYIVCFIVMYLSKSKVQTYEVEAGSLTTNSSYTGIAVRSEAVYRSEYSGNINYYQRENTRIKGNDTV